tara:strand:- start:2 stop:736 length:735 start_codon:yes stop_codon:yes gene_type:complete
MSNKLGIVIPTYQRPDGKTPELLTRTLNAINNQTYTNWKVYLIGDNYKDKKEFETLSKIIPQDKILAINLPVAVERNRYPEGGSKLWYSGGCNAVNIGIEFSINEGSHWVCRSDHDELWYNNHLEEIAKGIEKTNALFLYTKGKYLSNTILPININSSDLYINRRALPADTINSSCCVNYFIIQLRRRDPNYFYNQHDAGDAAFLKRVNNLLDQSNQPSILINKVTMENTQEGYAKTLTKKDLE